MTIKLIGPEQDIHLELPNGQTVTVQYREYEPGAASLDVLLPEPMVVYNWKGSNMTPAKSAPGGSHARLVDQLCIPLELG